jgi:TonB family protein
MLALAVMLSPVLAVPFAMAQSGAPMRQADEGSCAPVADSQSLPEMAPLNTDAAVRLQIVVAPGGRITDGHVMDGAGSGDAARDAAMLAHALRNWRYRPRDGQCRPVTLRVTVHYPHITCAPQPLPETQSAPDVEWQDRPRAVELRVGVAPDGRVTDAAVTRSSGDAALDAAAAAHVRQTWRWQPYACFDPAGNRMSLVSGAARVEFPYAIPDPPAR